MLPSVAQMHRQPRPRFLSPPSKSKPSWSAYRRSVREAALYLDKHRSGLKADRLQALKAVLSWVYSTAKGFPPEPHSQRVAAWHAETLRNARDAAQ